MSCRVELSARSLGRRSRSSSRRSYSPPRNPQAAADASPRRAATSAPASSATALLEALLARELGRARCPARAATPRAGPSLEIDLVAVPAQLPRDHDAHDALEVLGRAHAHRGCAQRARDPRHAARELARVEDGERAREVGVLGLGVPFRVRAALSPPASSPARSAASGPWARRLAGTIGVRALRRARNRRHRPRRGGLPARRGSRTARAQAPRRARERRSATGGPPGAGARGSRVRGAGASAAGVTRLGLGLAHPALVRGAGRAQLADDPPLPGDEEHLVVARRAAGAARTPRRRRRAGM